MLGRYRPPKNSESSSLSTRARAAATYPSGVPSLKGSSGRMTAGRGSRVHARAQEPGAMVCPTRRAVGVGRVGRSVLPSTGDPALDVVLVAVEARRVAAQFHE